MTGGGAPGAAGILRCLYQDPAYHVVVADANHNAVGRYLAEDFETIPAASDADFINAMLALCRKKNIHVILPLVTRELIPLSQHATEFELAGARALVSPSASIEIANDKSRLYEFLQWRGVEVPEFRVVETIQQFETAARELGFPNMTFCFKPSVSNGSRGFRIVGSGMDEWNLLFKEKPNSTFINYADATRILSSKPFPELLVSEYLPGEEFSVDCLARDGEAVLVIPRRRTRTINGISVQGEFVKEENIIEYCSRVIRELRAHGNIGMQVKKSASGRYLMLEVNPRVQGTTSACLGAGVNLPVLAIRQALGLPIHPDELHVTWGVKFCRYWHEVFY
jgi:carbamoyl-phosphate synthase large subunit